MTSTSNSQNLHLEAVSWTEEYLRRHEAEAGALSALQEQLKSTDDIFSRSNMTGHVTASCLVLRNDLEHVLMIHHNIYDKWLPPGGHVEPDEEESLIGASRREAMEETGVPVLVQMNFKDIGTALIDIDTHAIAANPKKGEGAHWHHDFMFLSYSPTDFEPQPQLEEVKAAKWLHMEDLARLPDARMQRIAAKLDAVVQELKSVQRRVRPH